MVDDENHKREFIEEQRAWLKNYRAESGLSWSELGKRTNIPDGTLSQFGGAKGYNGRELPCAEGVLRYRELLATRDTTFIDAPAIPEFFETQTSAEIINLLHWAQRGKMVYGALGSGLGKTKACEHFRTLYPHVYIVTFLASQGSQGPMQLRVLGGLGVESAKGQAFALSAMICQRLKTMHRPVLILDEAQHLTISALEELRGIHDETGCGMAFFGDKRLHDLIQNGSGKADIPQFRRRIKSMPLRMQPYQQDVAALAQAWNVTERRMIVELERAAQKPGGLGHATKMLEMATLMAAASKEVLGLVHLQEAVADDNRRGVAA